MELRSRNKKKSRFHSCVEFFRLVIKIPWFSLWTSSTIIELDGLHLLVVPITSVQYDEAKEAKEKFEAKQKRLEKAEEAKNLALTQDTQVQNETVSFRKSKIQFCKSWKNCQNIKLSVGRCLYGQ